MFILVMCQDYHTLESCIKRSKGQKVKRAKGTSLRISLRNQSRSYGKSELRYDVSFIDVSKYYRINLHPTDVLERLEWGPHHAMGVILHYYIYFINFFLYLILHLCLTHHYFSMFNSPLFFLRVGIFSEQDTPSIILYDRFQIMKNERTSIHILCSIYTI